MVTNGRTMDITKVMISGNLHSALLRLRQDDTPRIFWIDLLCINQTNPKERAEQVALMGKIYSAAQAVRVWLGELGEKDPIRNDLEMFSKTASKYGRDLDVEDDSKKGPSLKPGDTHDRFFQDGKETYDIPRLPDLTRPDYIKSTAKVYADFTIWWIKEHKSLRILSTVHTLHGRTWMNLESHLSHDRDDNDRPSWTLWYNGDSSWARASLSLIDPVEYRVSLKGIRISTIIAFDVFPIPQSYTASPLLAAYFQIFDPAGYRWLWQTFTHAPPDGALTNTASLDTLQRVFTRHLSAHYTALEGAKEPYLPSHGKPVFTTADGHKGLRPSGARVGDVVVILYGGMVPYILRPGDDGETYTFVGESFLEDFMHGEAFDERSGDFRGEEEVFYLV
ncbi:HET-domain-containing protein [Ophiobolus disseminans]|uniref:HET-domain-containing protein n=1 Tax=Ophiobolus disseminans TaxID=1469910 RepID=A0A6A6ZW60_9PLEO|nr:HET-domain-containing protein [Ophiobolus disseminans]